MSRPKNVLWIMCDQLRFDYLGCTGHPTLRTPNIGAMATRGVRLSNAYVQSPICGPSRMSFYTGRYMRSHGSHWNGWPLRGGEPTLGDHLEKIGVRNVLVGKTHMTPDLEGLKMLGNEEAERQSQKQKKPGGHQATGRYAISQVWCVLRYPARRTVHTSAVVRTIPKTPASESAAIRASS